jgi:hypothetical protein
MKQTTVRRRGRSEIKVERLCHYNIGRVAVWATTVGGGETDDKRLGLGHWAMMSTNQTKQINQAITKNNC